MAASEIFMNTQLLKDVVGGGEGLTISTIVSFFNVVVSFLIARLCLTHIFNPVSSSSSKGSYIFFTTLGGIAIVYINFMMGVYRGLIERANEAGDMTQYLILSQQAAVEAVFPFDNFDVITFQSSFLMVVGFYILGPFCWIFLPSVIVSLFTSSEKVKLISVYIMFGLGMFSLLRLLPGHGLSI